VGLAGPKLARSGSPAESHKSRWTDVRGTAAYEETIAPMKRRSWGNMQGQGAGWALACSAEMTGFR